MFNKIESFSIYLFWIACVLNPTPSEYQFKIYSLLLVLLLLSFRFSSLGSVRLSKYYIFYSFFMMLTLVYGLFVSSIRGGLSGEFIDTSYFTSALYFVASGLYFFSRNYLVALGAMVFSLRLIVFLIIYSFFVVYFDFDSFVLRFFMESGAAYIGMRSYGGFDFYYIYYIVSPMLIFLICYETHSFLNKKNGFNLVLLVLSVLALFLSGTRANMLLAVFAPMFLLAWFYIGRLIYFYFVFILVAIVSFVFLLEVPVLYQMLSPYESSNSVKFDYTLGYAEIFSQLSVLIFGQGFNAHVWDPVIFDMLPDAASKTELTYFEIFRVYGVLGFLLFIFVFLYLIFSNKIYSSYSPWVGPALFLYLLVSFTNPYIFSSNGMLLLGLSIAALSVNRGSIIFGGKDVQ